MRRLFLTTTLILSLTLLSGMFFIQSSKALTFSKSPTAITTGLNSGLVGWWTFDGADVGSTYTLDKSGKGNTGTRTGTKAVSGKLGQAMYFNGTGDYIKKSSPTGLDFSSTAQPFTASVWIKPAVLDSSYDGIISAKNTEDSNWMLQRNSPNAFFTFSYGLTDFVNFPIVTTNVWHHYVAVYNGTTIVLYFDGATYGSPVTRTGTNVNANIICFGPYRCGDTTQHFFNGSIDDVRIYNRALSTAEIQQLYKMGGGKISKSPTGITTGLNTGLVGWWTFDGADTGLSSGVRYAIDKSGYGNTALSGDAATSPISKIGKIGQAMYFDGADDYVDLPSNSLYSFGTSDFAISAWFNIKTTASVYLTSGIISKDEWQKRQWRFSIAQNGTTMVQFENMVDNHALLSTSFISINAWHHTVVSRTGNATSLYVDGVYQAQTSSVLSNYNITSNPRLGNWKWTAGYNNLKGYLDDVRIYNRALSLAEIQQLYKMGGGKISKSPTAITTGLNSGLIGWWTFDGADVNATQVLDKAGTNNGTRNSLALGAGKIGQAGKFNGTSSYVSLGGSTILNQQGTLTLSSWFKLSGDYTSAQSIIINSLSGTSANYGLTFGYDDNKIDFWQTAGYYYPSNVSISDNNWHFVLVTRSGSTGNWTIKFYIDGVLDKTQTSAIDPNAGTTDPVSIGRFGDYAGHYFKGLLDDVRIYNRALSAAEIQQLYKMGK